MLEGRDGHPGAALSLLSRDRYWSVDSAVGYTLFLNYSCLGQSPEVKQQTVDMAINAGGIHDTARVLHVSPTTVINELLIKPDRHSVNHALLAALNPEDSPIATQGMVQRAGSRQ